MVIVLMGRSLDQNKKVMVSRHGGIVAAVTAEQKQQTQTTNKNTTVELINSELVTSLTRVFQSLLARFEAI